MQNPTPPSLTIPNGSNDIELIRWMLALTPAERLDVLQGFVDSVDELRRAQPSEV